MTTANTLTVRSLSTGLVLALCLFYHTSNAQTEAAMFTMSGVPQSTNYNPAFVPNYKFIFSPAAPSAHIHYSNNGFSGSDFAVKQGDSTVVDLQKLNDALRKKNYLTIATDVEVFRLGFRVNPRIYFNWFVTAKAYTRTMLPKDLFGLITSGTEQFVNATASLSPEIEAFGYVESAWGVSYVVNRKLTAGLRFKYLKGAGSVTSDDSELNISIDNDYAYTITARANAKTSGINNMDDIDYKNYLKNSGFAFDFGATYKLTDRLTLGASLLDIGGITWKNDTYGYSLDPTKATYTFGGVDLEKIVNGDDDYLDAEMDSVEARFKPTEGAIGSYRTPLPSKMYLNANYDWLRKVSFGGVVMMEKFRGRFTAGVSGYVHKEFGRVLGASINLTAANRSYTNLGAGINFNLSPLQIYLAGDNLLQIPLSYASSGDFNKFIYNTHFVNLRFGLNFVFGRIRTAEKLPYPKQPK